MSTEIYYNSKYLYYGRSLNKCYWYILDINNNNNNNNNNSKKKSHKHLSEKYAEELKSDKMQLY